MKLITLNTWGGRIPAVIPFIEGRKADTDIFCFQEVYSSTPISELEVPNERGNLFEELSDILPEFTGYFSPKIEGYGSCTFVRKSIVSGDPVTRMILTDVDLESERNEGGPYYEPRNLLTVQLTDYGISVHNFHGVPGSGKKDTHLRDLQTERLLDVLKSGTGTTILVGDFNLNPDTDAIRALEQILNNPLAQSGFTTTRSNHYNKQSIMPFADYIFISSTIPVKHFSVLPDVVSDHLALLVEF